MQRLFTREIEENLREQKRLEAILHSQETESLQKRKEIEAESWISIDMLVEANKTKLTA